ncbi:OprO/OprP family phosphate-selective porin [Nitrosovibrio sp. Nv17]|uniref:OprO/OprP family phosphate-selective porin n=1 Tax=Nitrosovibrio sp. Nv17 TaxID=1855339 RepID=UPI0009088A1D|nr:porin [Nitrosovibrio sp. Nv17]SFW15369.1 phosphate-selective porin OprO and OprP [Nitrosovibrio sp. Nv17]
MPGNDGSQPIFQQGTIGGVLRYRAFALFVVLASLSIVQAYAFDITTQDGFRILADDGNLEVILGARAHLDVHAFNDDSARPGQLPFGSQVPGSHPDGGFNFRRGYTDITVRFHDLSLKFQNDFAAGTFPGSLREAWVGARVGPGQLTIGQFKPYRGMEELASSNEITLLERPSTSSTGVYAGRQWLMGVGYKGLYAEKVGYAAHVMSMTHFGMPVAGSSIGGRLFWAPLSEEGNTLHLGFSYSMDHSEADSLPAKVVDIYGGRRGVSFSLGTAGSAGSSGGGDQSTFGAEAAYALGPVTLQGEYVSSRLEHTHATGGMPRNSTVQAYYVQASWFATGERSIYSKERGAFGKPRPLRKWGALEFAARYDRAENLNQSLLADPCRTGTSKCQVQIITLGINWYVRKNWRFMLNYYFTDAAIGHASMHAQNRNDTLSAVSFRTQLGF